VPAPIIVRLGHFVFRYRDYLAPVGVALVVLLSAPHQFSAGGPLAFWWNLVGVLVALGGQALRALVIGLAYIQRGGAKKSIAAERLVVDGIFAHSRNPLYLGNLLLLLGLMLIWNSLAGYILVAAAAVALFAMVRAEETFLLGKFGGEFEAYCARVPRFLPDPRGLRATLRRFTFDWKRVLRKEYGTTFSWTTTAVLLLALERAEWQGFAAARSVLGGLAVTWVGLALLWATVRWLKKHGRLASPQ
jgi:protein-S-isoprenylcysteine O-methyltransferase Ste14